MARDGPLKMRLWLSSMLLISIKIRRSMITARLHANIYGYLVSNSINDFFVKTREANHNHHLVISGFIYKRSK